MQESYRFSAPGRTEICGNHTDHQHGCVLAAAVNLETRAELRLNGTDEIRIFSEGYAPFSLMLGDYVRREEEKNTSKALVRGIAASFAKRGARLQGFDASLQSTVLPGSGLSSSAAFEVLIGTIFNELFYDKRLTPLEIAQLGQSAENDYFGKPCGLMDQTASAVGGLVYIDFADPKQPIVEKLDYDFVSSNHALCIIDSGADHADLTDEYAAIPQEMRSVAAALGKQVLRDVDEGDFYAALPMVRSIAGDRAALRAIHFFEDNRRVAQMVCALRQNDFSTFLKLVNLSGASSWRLLQNVIPSGSIGHQELALALALAQKLLGERGAVRVHGGGFAGTLQAFVPMDCLDMFKAGMEAVLGQGTCHCLSICPEGGMQRYE